MGKKVKPVVYSAIECLENVNQQNLGSFNSKVYLASHSKNHKSKKERNSHSRRNDPKDYHYHHDHPPKNIPPKTHDVKKNANLPLAMNDNKNDSKNDTNNRGSVKK